MTKARRQRSAGRGKKIDTVYFDVEHVQSGDERGADKRVFRKAEIDIYIEKRFDQNPDSPAPAQTLGMAVTARCEELDIQEFGTDINAVLTAIRSKLSSAFQIKWERWLLVRVDPARLFNGSGSGLELSWRDVERGIAPDGSVLMRSYNLYAEWGNRWVTEPWPKVVKEKGRIVAAIPSTETNEKALKTFAAKIDDLRRSLAELVAPEEIERTLQMVAAAPIAALVERKSG